MLPKTKGAKATAISKPDLPFTREIGKISVDDGASGTLDGPRSDKRIEMPLKTGSIHHFTEVHFFYSSEQCLDNKDRL